MKPALGPRAQVVLILAFVATIGAFIGILGDRYVARQRADAAPAVERGTMPRGGMMPGMRYGDGLATRLDLSAEQRAQIDSILAQDRLRARELTRQFQPQFRSLAEETRARVEAVLTAEQRDELRAMRQQRMRRGDMRPGDMPADMRPGLRRNGVSPAARPDSGPPDTVRQP